MIYAGKSARETEHLPKVFSGFPILVLLMFLTPGIAVRQPVETGGRAAAEILGNLG